MSIAVVSADRYLVDSLHEIFNAWGIGPFFSFKNMGEFNLAFQRAQKQLTILMMDGELPVSDQVMIRSQFGRHRVLKQSVFGWIGAVTESNEQSLSDFHFWVRRPLGSKKLLLSAFQGSRNRRMENCEIIHLGEPATESSRDLFTKKQIRVVTAFDDPVLWDLRLNRSKTGIILINPAGLSSKLIRWLELYKNTSHCRNSLQVCLSRDANVVAPVRVFCKIFADLPQNERAMDFWLRFLRTRFYNDLEIRFHRASIKCAIRRADFKRAIWHAKTLHRSFNGFYESKLVFGIVHKALGNIEKAESFFQEAKLINPFAPELYAQLLSLKPVSSTQNEQLKQAAKNHCPNWLAQFEASL